MATTYYAPDPIQSMQFIPGGIVPANGGQLFFYAAGTSTKTTVYKDNAGAVAWSNPIVLDSGGNLPSGGEVWFQSGVTYKVVFAPSNDTDPPTSPYWTKDNLQGTNDVSGQISALEWITGGTPTFVSTTSFTLIGDQTAIYTSGRRIKTTNTGGTIYSTIVRSTFGAGLTTVTVINDSGVLDAGLSAVSYGLLSATNPSVPVTPDNQPIRANTTDRSKIWQVSLSGLQSSTTVVETIPGYSFNTATQNNVSTVMSSASTTFASSVAGDALQLTGTTGIDRFVLFDGQRLEVHAVGSTPLNNSTTFSLTGGVNMTTAAGDWFALRGTSSSTVMEFYQRQAGQAVVPTLTLLQQVLLGGASTAINVTSGINSNFDEYEMHVYNMIPGTNAVDIDMFVSVDGGSTYITSVVYEYNISGIQSNSFISGFSSGATTAMPLTGIGNLSNQVNLGGYSGITRFFAPSSTTMFKMFQSDGLYAQQGTQASVRTIAVGRYNSTAAINALQLKMSSGNINSGTVRLYGVKKT